MAENMRRMREGRFIQTECTSPKVPWRTPFTNLSVIGDAAKRTASSTVDTTSSGLNHPSKP
jgi:hypothetical protein